MLTRLFVVPSVILSIGVIGDTTAAPAGVSTVHTKGSTTKSGISHPAAKKHKMSYASPSGKKKTPRAPASRTTTPKKLQLGNFHKKTAMTMLLTSFKRQDKYLHLMVKGKRHSRNKFMGTSGKGAEDQQNLVSEEDIKEQWFSQAMNHFAAAEDGNDPSPTWSQRYFVNDVYYKSGGPIFLMIGGEGALEVEEVQSAPFIAGHLAKEWDGAVFGLEHRFYGKSQPTGDHPSSSDLALLSSQQAIADLASFVKAFQKDEKYAASANKWVCLGGSYPGNLAVWLRQTHPELVTGCLGFSAPIFAKADFFEYGQMLYKALGHDAGSKLLSGYQSIVDELRYGTLNARREVIVSRLGVCPFSILSDGDMSNVEAILTRAISEIVQYNGLLGPGLNVSDVVELVNSAEDGEAAAWAVTQRYIGVGYEDDDDSYKTDYDYNSSNCDDLGVKDLYEQVQEDVDYRSWFYQTCTEFGYFQTSRVSSHGVKTLYTPGASNEALWQGTCRELFGIADVEQRVAKTRSLYDVKDVTERTVFINGSMDPWSVLSRGEFSDETRQVFGFTIPDGSHCAGMYWAPDTPIVTPETLEIQKKIIAIVQGWLQTPESTEDDVEIDTRQPSNDEVENSDESNKEQVDSSEEFYV